eukprot:g23899.t1
MSDSDEEEGDKIDKTGLSVAKMREELQDMSDLSDEDEPSTKTASPTQGKMNLEVVSKGCQAFYKENHKETLALKKGEKERIREQKKAEEILLREKERAQEFEKLVLGEFWSVRLATTWKELSVLLVALADKKAFSQFEKAHKQRMDRIRKAEGLQNYT